MMRRVLAILMMLLGVTCVKAQVVWFSPDGYSQYAVVEFDLDDPSKIMIGEKNRSPLDYLSSVIKSTKEKINSQEYRVWVESYVGLSETDFEANKVVARTMSNVVKSHLILTDGLSEDDFTTRNYSGTFNGLRSATIIVIGMRYPIEEIVPKQRLDDRPLSPESKNEPPLSLNTQEAREAIAVIGIDTTTILNTKFQPMTFGGVTPKRNEAEQVATNDGEFDTQPPILIEDRGIDYQNVDRKAVIDADTGGEQDSVNRSVTLRKEQRAKLQKGVGHTVATELSLITPGSVTQVVKITNSEHPISSCNIKKALSKEQQRAIDKQTALKKREIDKKLEEQSKQEKQAQKAENQQARQQLKEAKIEERRQKTDSGTARNEQNSQIANVAVAGGVQVNAATSGSNAAKVISMDELTKLGVDNVSMGTNSAPQQTSIDAERQNTANRGANRKRRSKESKSQEAGLLPASPKMKVISMYELNSLGVDNISMGQSSDNQSLEVPDATIDGKRGSSIKNSQRGGVMGREGKKFDGASIEQLRNKELLAAQQVVEREQKSREQKAVRQITYQRKVERLRTAQTAKGRFAVAGIGINALTTLALKPSMQFDAYFSDRFSVAAEWYYSKWNFEQSKVFNLSMGSVELRFFCTGKRKAFEGLYVGLYGGAGDYDFRWGTQDGRQSQFVTAGLSLGYVLPIGKSGFYLEAGLSAGYVAERIDKYVLFEKNYINLNENFTNTTFFAPTKIKVSFIYRLFNQRKNRE